MAARCAIVSHIAAHLCASTISSGSAEADQAKGAAATSEASELTVGHREAPWAPSCRTRGLKTCGRTPEERLEL